jgi:hypothetical protein
MNFDGEIPVGFLMKYPKVSLGGNFGNHEIIVYEKNKLVWRNMFFTFHTKNLSEFPSGILIFVLGDQRIRGLRG